MSYSEPSPMVRGRFLELAKKSEKASVFTYTDFLGLLEQNLFLTMEKELFSYTITKFGGIEDAERIIVRFGSENDVGYDEPFPISALSVTPVSRRFAEELTHRDVLGALMNLGIERSLIGDIYIKENNILIFCLTKIKDFLMESLTKIRHTEVSASEYIGDFSEFTANYEEMDIQISSERLDAVISRVLHLSREKGQALIKQGKVFVNGKNVFSYSLSPRENDKITVRGFGRFKYIGPVKTTKKGNLLVRILRNS